MGQSCKRLGDRFEAKESNCQRLVRRTTMTMSICWPHFWWGRQFPFAYFQISICLSCSYWCCFIVLFVLSFLSFNPIEWVRRGIPHYFRAIVWQLLCGASDADKKQYADYIKATSACEKVIRRDIARTYPEHDFFKEKDGLGQEALFNVMKAYSLHDREVEYPLENYVVEYTNFQSQTR